MGYEEENLTQFQVSRKVLYKLLKGKFVISTLCETAETTIARGVFRACSFVRTNECVTQSSLFVSVGCGRARGGHRGRHRAVGISVTHSLAPSVPAFLLFSSVIYY